MEGIGEAYDKVVKKHRTTEKETEKYIDLIISNLSAFQENKQSGLVAEVKSLSQKLSEETKDHYSVFQKLSKAVDKKFKTDLDNVWDPKAIKGKDDLVQVLLKYFVREGRFDLAQIFAEEAGIKFEQELYTQYVEMFHIQEALRKKDPDLAIQWATQYSRYLRDSGSSLEFKLHRIKYLTLVKSFKITEALEYAKKHFIRFASSQLKGILF
jgi:E3 ubiquitin-protein transferase RMND5